MVLAEDEYGIKLSTFESVMFVDSYHKKELAFGHHGYIKGLCGDRDE